MLPARPIRHHGTAVRYRRPLALNVDIDAFVVAATTEEALELL